MRQYAPIIGFCRHRLHTDGEGVSTLIAFHGCPLRCRYCLNPQSLEREEDWDKYDCATLYEKTRIDELYFLATRGGVTFGGSEPCLRSEFIRDFRQFCGKDWLLTLETSLNVPQRHIEGHVVVKFTVKKNGNITDAIILKSLDPRFDDEVLRVIYSMPKWKPGTQRGKPVDVRYTIPVTFKLASHK